MNRLTPMFFFLSIFFVFIFVWFIGNEDRLTALFWMLPGVLIGMFSMLWKSFTRIERRVSRLERERDASK